MRNNIKNPVQALTLEPLAYIWVKFEHQGYLVNVKVRKTNVYFTQYLFLCLYFIEIDLKVMVKVKVTQHQDQIKGNKFSIGCKCLCDVDAADGMLFLGLKGILVFFVFFSLRTTGRKKSELTFKSKKSNLLSGVSGHVYFELVALHYKI